MRLQPAGRLCEDEQRENRYESAEIEHGHSDSYDEADAQRL